MKLTLQQAADELGKSLRQIRYLIKLGKLPATKIGGRWYVDSDGLPRTPGQVAAHERKQARLLAVVEDTLGLPPPEQRRRYSLKDLRAFQIAALLYREAAAALDANHPACRALRDTLEALARGCHRYADADKAAAYREARDAASKAACELALADTTGAGELLERLEQEWVKPTASSCSCASSCGWPRQRTT